MSSLEQTLSIIKPDAVERNLIDEIKNIFTKNNLNIKEDKKIHLTKEEAAEFYKVHQTKPFYDKLCSYLSSGPINAIILDGKNAIQKNRDLMGDTDPKKAKEGTIRKKYAKSKGENAVHGSDSDENAEIEISFHFDNEEIFS